MVEAGHLDVLLLRARFTPHARLAFPFGAAVPVRGALGYSLPEEIFRPHRDVGPSGLRDAPRPFVLRVRQLDGRTFASGEPFEIGLNLFAPSMLPAFEESLRRLASAGLGPNRVGLDWGGLETSSETFDLDRVEPCKTLEVFFLSPTEMKGWNGPGLPPFEILAARVRDRVSALCSLYGCGEPGLDYRGLAERARAVRAVSGELTRVLASRTSARTGQTHPLSGVTGPVRYEGELSEFVPLLRAACRTGVGRQTVWGHGEIAINLSETEPRP
ncbi:MAG: CRISPR system precrRNA processing endoribonuclease RAMP protein Cas6 [Bryobacteraceae bacterium]|nr:CRISPR system precrRNA processing endoribonuclease RAMP protein Cas6 [Bryobacteraceae bacterium]